jgi:hypothetical protein
MIDTDKYEKLIESIVICEEEWIKGQDSLVEDSRRLKACATRLLAEVERLREVMIHVEQRQPHPALEWALKEGLTLAEIMERVE